ncbi:MAG: GNAT family N-acetyltransferase, partial [Bacteroidia bacterium]
MDWEIKPFDELLPVELYNIMRLRGEVFVVEQTCPYLDADGKDPKCLHLMGYSGSSVLSVSSKEKTSGNIVSEAKELIAYSRIVPAGISYKEVSIGRVVS